MLEKTRSYQELLKEMEAMRQQLEETRSRLEEATDTIEAIRSGEVDALVVKGEEGHQLYTLTTADQNYRIFIEQMIEGAVTLSRDGTILYSNSRFADLIDLPLEKVIGQSFYKFIENSDNDDCRDLVEKAWEKDTKGELNLQSGKGHIPVLLSLKALNFDEGLSMSIILTDLSTQKEIYGLLQKKNLQLEEAKQIVQDMNHNLEKTVLARTADLEKNIQEKTKVEEELRNNQERLSRILETMAEGVVIMDKAGRLTYANPLAQKLLGLRHDQETPEGGYLNSGWETTCIDGTELPTAEHPMQLALRTGKPVYDHEIGIRRPNKDLFYVSINAAPLYDEDGGITGSVGTLMDVTARRRDLQQKDDFISVASHELKTPITSLKGYLQMLQQLKDKPSAELLPDIIGRANKCMVRVSRLIDDLLNTSKITQGQWQLNKTKFQLAKVAEECSLYIRSNSDANIQLEGDMHLEVQADFNRIGQVITNFLNNAVKYATASKEIRITIGREKEMAKLSVTDRGPGISPEKLPHIFERYFRADDRGAHYSGLGLGLYICSEVIKKHEGAVGVESEPGKGSTFWFTLPV